MAAGDLTYVEQTQPITLTAAQVQLLRAFVDSIWSGQIANVFNVYAWRESGSVFCQVNGKRKVAPSALPMDVMVIERE